MDADKLEALIAAAVTQYADAAPADRPAIAETAAGAIFALLWALDEPAPTACGMRKRLRICGSTTRPRGAAALWRPAGGSRTWARSSPGGGW